MRTCIDHLIALSHIDGPRVKREASFLAQRLETLRLNKNISNDAYLDAGAIQGAFEMIAHLIDMGVPQKEVHSQLRQQLDRANNIEVKHPGLNSAIEQGRAS
jgi:hypothetical protein